MCIVYKATGHRGFFRLLIEYNFEMQIYTQTSKEGVLVGPLQATRLASVLLVVQRMVYLSYLPNLVF